MDSSAQYLYKRVAASGRIHDICRIVRKGGGCYRPPPGRVLPARIFTLEAYSLGVMPVTFLK